MTVESNEYQPDERITLGELSRTCQDIKDTLGEMRKEAKEDRHELRNDLNKVCLQFAVLETRVDVIEDAHGSNRNWVAGLISGTIVAIIAWVLNFLGHPK